jgi:hypothetical protein
MGYTIGIGQLVTEHYDETYVGYGVEGAHHDEAPAFGEPTDFTNARWPSYSSWQDALFETGTEKVFFTPTGHVIGEHPGFREITQELYDEFKTNMTAFEDKHPDIKATYKGTVNDGRYCRLVWLDYWLKWALANCENPVIVNS